MTGEDTAGNSTDGELTFTVIERPATQIALNPGVNLISLPGNPATTSIEGVITNPDITSVLTYDPSTPTKWLAAERAPDGSWVGNLTEISGSLGYWVTTTSFDSLDVDIVSFSAGGASLPPTHNLVPGWNLVAVTTLDEVVKTGDADSGGCQHLPGQQLAPGDHVRLCKWSVCERRSGRRGDACVDGRQGLLRLDDQAAHGSPVTGNPATT